MDLSEVLDGVAARLRIEAVAITSQVQHRGSKGRMRELALIEELLRRYMPRNVLLAHSAEVAAVGSQTSPECDIAVYDPDVPPLIETAVYRVLPVESLYGVIEVRTRLDAAGLKKAFRTIRRVKRLPKDAVTYPPNMINFTRYDRSTRDFPVAGFVFAFDSIGLPTLVSQLATLHAGVPAWERIDSVWVLNEGCIVNCRPGTDSVLVWPDSTSVLRAARSDNPLALMIAHLQETFQEAGGLPISLERYGSRAFNPTDWLT